MRQPTLMAATPLATSASVMAEKSATGNGTYSTIPLSSGKYSSTACVTVFNASARGFKSAASAMALSSMSCKFCIARKPSAKAGSSKKLRSAPLCGVARVLIALTPLPASAANWRATKPAVECAIKATSPPTALTLTCTARRKRLRTRVNFSAAVISVSLTSEILGSRINHGPAPCTWLKSKASAGRSSVRKSMTFAALCPGQSLKPGSSALIYKWNAAAGAPSGKCCAGSNCAGASKCVVGLICADSQPLTC